jgi:acyl-CoA synthetase (AMP-forming)/AMP-acid ligase II
MKSDQLASITYKKNNILEALNEIIASHPDRAAVISGDGSIRYSYAQVDERSNRLANALVKMGIGKKDRVALFLNNRWQYVELYWAILKIGAVCVPANYRLKGPQASFILNESGAKVLFFEERYLPVFDDICPYLLGIERYVCIGEKIPDWAENYENLISQSEAGHLPPVDLNLDDICTICYTSGTTGLPKGSTSTHRNLMVNFYDCFGRLIQEDARDIKRGYTINLLTVPLYHIAGIISVYLTSSLGGTLVIPEAFAPENFMEIVQRERITTTYLVPTMFKFILDHPRFKQYDLSSLKFISYGAMPMHPDLLQKILEEFPRHIKYMDAFGCTELNATCIAKLPEDHDLTGYPEQVKKKLHHLKGIGRPMTEGIEVGLFTEDGSRAAVEQVGEVACRGDKVTLGYWRNPEANEKAFKNGWFYMGDLAWKDEDGYFYFADRKKDMINRAGENIFPAEVEAVVIQHPAVNEVAVFGIPDITWGTKVCAAVVLLPGQNATEEELKKFTRSKLASYKCPANFYFLDELPRTFAGGKVMRRILRERYSQSL